MRVWHVRPAATMLDGGRRDAGWTEWTGAARVERRESSRVLSSRPITSDTWSTVAEPKVSVRWTVDVGARRQTLQVLRTLTKEKFNN